MKTKLICFLSLSITILFAQDKIDINTYNQEILYLSINYLESAIIGPIDNNSDKKVVSYKIKIPKSPTLKINGNKFISKVLGPIKKANKNAVFIIFDIQTKDKKYQKNVISFKIKQKKKWRQ